MVPYEFYAVAEDIYAFATAAKHIYVLSVKRMANYTLFKRTELDDLLVEVGLDLYPNGSETGGYATQGVQWDARTGLTIATIVQEWFCKPANAERIGVLVFYNQDGNGAKRSGYFSRLYERYGQELFHLESMQFLGEFCSLFYLHDHPLKQEIAEMLHNSIVDGVASAKE